MPQYQLCRRLCDNHTPRICIRLDKVKKKKERRKKKKEKNPCALQHVVHATKVKSKYSYGVQFPYRLEKTQKETPILRYKRKFMEHLQCCAFENQQSPFYVVNEVTLTGQKPSLRFC